MQVEDLRGELHRRLDEGAYRVLTHSGFRRLWSTRVRAVEVGLDAFIKAMDGFIR